MDMFPFCRIAIINRGEPAIRLIRAVRELNEEHNLKLKTIALYTEPDSNGMFVREADEAYNLGNSTFYDRSDNRTKSTYLNYTKLANALTQTHAEAAWVGWGFVAEHAEFADLCVSLGITFIGPPGEVMRRLGDKISAKIVAESCQVPVAPWSGGPIRTIEEAREHAARIGFPLMLKATAGGGGRGIRKIKDEAELNEAFDSARAEASKAFGDDTVFVEKMIPAARHIEVQIVSDQDNNAWALGVRDCSIQRRNQKVIEEAPCPALLPEIEASIKGAAVRLARSVNYINAGTVEFLYTPHTQSFYFMEMNTRLQVEHPVTELTTNVDIVKLQLKIAAGLRLSGSPPQTNGHAIEVRLNAEDPDNNFAPSPGKLSTFRLPAGPGLRIDSGVTQDDTIPPDFDSMIAKIIAYGRSREEALARLRRGLLESAVIIDGGTSNKSFLLELLRHPDVVRGQVDIAWLDRLRGEKPPARGLADIALLRAALLAYEEELSFERQTFLATAARGRPSIRSNIGTELELRYGPHSYKFLVRRQAPQTYQLSIDGVLIRASLQQLSRNEVWLSVGEARYRLTSIHQGAELLIEADGIPHKIKRDDGGVVRASSPAVVLSLRVKEGEFVSLGQTLVVLEAMKMEMPVLAPEAGRVRQLMVSANEQVAAGAPLLVLEATQADTVNSGPARIDFSELGVNLEGQTQQACVEALKTMRNFLLGFDIEPSEVRTAIQKFELTINQCAPGDPELLSLEEQTLSILSDLLAVYSRNYISTEYKISPAECLTRFFRTIDGGGKGLPEIFLDRLLGLLSHYGVLSHTRSPELEEALLWSQKAEARIDLLSEPAISLLERRLQHIDLLSPHTTPHFCGLLDRLIDATYPNFLAINDLARQTRFIYFDKPALEGTQAQERAQKELRLLTEKPDHPQRKEFILSLAHSPQPIINLLTPMINQPELGSLPLEILVRRFYRETQLDEIKTWSSPEGSFLLSEYELQRRRLPLFALLTQYGELERGLPLLVWHMNKLPPQQEIRIDCYLYSPPEEIPSGENFIKVLKGAGLTERFGRVCFAVVTPPKARAEYFTFALDGSTAREIPEYRGVHPMWAGRLELWRLRDFNTERLASPEDAYLYRAIAKTNPKDERLFAFLDVRDLTPLSADTLQLPCLENLFLETLSYMRSYLYRLPAEKRLLWNRIMIYLWPELDLELASFKQVIERLARETSNLGIEKIVVRARSKPDNIGSSPGMPRFQDAKSSLQTPQELKAFAPELWGVSLADMPAVSAPVLPPPSGLFRARKEVLGGITALWLIGPLNQTTNFKRIADGLEGQVVLVMEEVSEISEVGLERFASLQQITDAQFCIARASAAMLSGISTFKDRFEAFKLASVLLPTSCRYCGLWLSIEADAELLSKSNTNSIPASTCPRCGTADSHSCDPKLLTMARALVSQDIPSEVLSYLRARPTREDLQPSGLTYELPTLKDYSLHFTLNSGQVVRFRIGKPSTYPIRPLNLYAQRVIQLRSRGLVYPYEIIRLMTAPLAQQAVQFPPGEFVEHDLVEQRLLPVQRSFGENTANLVVGVIKNFTKKHPEGMTRVLILGDASREMGALAEAECRRIIAAIDLAEAMGVPVEWFPISSGAKISMDSGTENLDWTAAVLRRVVEFTQQGGVINLLVLGINVGAQSYWNAEATMMMHTKGILVMVPEASMVLTGKKALEYSGSVAAPDHAGIGGIETIMGPNGEAQYLASNTSEALKILFQYYEHSYIAPGEKLPRRATTTDPISRNIAEFPYHSHSGESFKTIGEIFSQQTNPSRKKPFSIRPVMQAVIDQDWPPLERWSMMREAEMAVVWDAHVGGFPLCLIGVESRSLSRGGGYLPGDGPDTFTGGTLFPLSSKKVARALNAASGIRPVVILANLSGFDGSPESMRKLQLEYGAEIGRAVVNFQGPLMLIVISRYHGGAYVVFSRALNKNLDVSALRGSYASVIGGAPAAAVVLTREVSRRVYTDPRIITLQQELQQADDNHRTKLTARYNAILKEVQREKQGQMAEEFDKVHSIERAKQVGSINHILEPHLVRQYIVETLEQRTTGG